MKQLYFFLSFLFSINSIYAQSADDNVEKQTIQPKSIFGVNTRDFSNKGKFFAHWGYNISWYGKSDINFKGNGYNFTLKDVVAKDRPTPLSTLYLNPVKVTIPQFNFHVGYFIKDNYSISIGWDHMKYVVDVPQTVKISGYIDPQVSNPGINTGSYAGTYDNDDLTIQKDFLTFEHTDGFNYASAEVERYDDMWVSRSNEMYLTMQTGVSLGAVVPRSDVRLFGVGDNHYWNVAGYGFSAKAGLKFHLSKWFYLQSDIKAGWTNLSRIHTTGRNNIDRASQKITFLENYWLFGFQF